MMCEAKGKFTDRAREGIEAVAGFALANLGITLIFCMFLGHSLLSNRVDPSFQT